MSAKEGDGSVHPKFCLGGGKGVVRMGGLWFCVCLGGGVGGKH